MVPTNAISYTLSLTRDTAFVSSVFTHVPLVISQPLFGSTSLVFGWPSQVGCRLVSIAIGRPLSVSFQKSKSTSSLFSSSTLRGGPYSEKARVPVAPSPAASKSGAQSVQPSPASSAPSTPSEKTWKRMLTSAPAAPATVAADGLSASVAPKRTCGRFV